MLEDKVHLAQVGAEFGALYLRGTVAGFISYPLQSLPQAKLNAVFAIQNAYLHVLTWMQLSPYFAKYLRSSDPRASNNKQLATVLAERVLVVAPMCDQSLRDPSKIPAGAIDFLGPVTSTLDFLNNICVFYTKHDINTVVPDHTRIAMNQFLRKWCVGSNVELARVSKTLFMKPKDS